MNIEQQVCTLEQAIKLASLGVSPESMWYWQSVGEDNFQLSLFHYGYTDDEFFKAGMNAHNGIDISDFNREYFSAYNVAELGMMLPNEAGVLCSGSQYNDHIKQWQAWSHAIDGDGVDNDHETKCDTEAEARAALLIHLLESGKITPEEIYSRLTPPL